MSVERTSLGAGPPSGTNPGEMLVVEPESSPARPRIVEAVDQAGFVPQPCGEIETALQRLEASLADSSRIVSATLGPLLSSQVAAAHRLHARAPDCWLVFVASDTSRAEAMRRSLIYDPILGRHWSVLPLDDPTMLVDGLRTAGERTLLRQSFERTIQLVNRQLATMRPLAPHRTPLLASERYLASVMQQARDAIVALDPRGEVVAWNQGAESLFGIASNQALGTQFWMLSTTQDQAIWRRWFRKARDGAGFRRELTWRTPDGTPRDLEVSFAPVTDDDDQIVGVSVIARDVSERRRAEAALREANRLQSQFLATASHELRTPLTSMLGFAQRLQRQFQRTDEPLDREKVLRALETVVRSGQHLARLIDELLDVSRARQGLLDLHRAPVDLGDLVRRVAARMDLPATREPASLLPSAGVQVSQRIRVETPDEAVVGQWDPSRVEQVVEHLLSNALKYSPEGTIVTVRVWCFGDDAFFDVQDRGMGIPVEDQARLFEPFFRTAAAEHLGGVGLGLYVCREIVHHHGGEVWVESEAGQGTTVHVRLPLRPR